MDSNNLYNDKRMAMDKTEILRTANEYITKDRQSTHGQAENNFANIARLWSAYLNHPITPQDVAILMTLLKVARYKGNPSYVDNAIDMCGYAALAGELGQGAINEIK
jgi:hypothetical protein